MTRNILDTKDRAKRYGQYSIASEINIDSFLSPSLGMCMNYSYEYVTKLGLGSEFCEQGLDSKLCEQALGFLIGMIGTKLLG